MNNAAPLARLAFVASLAVLAGCVSVPAPRTGAPALPSGEVVGAEAAQARREAALATTRWALEGRVALSNGRQGGSGRLEWEGNVAATDYTVSLSAPVTRQSWRLDVDSGGARLEGLDGGPRVDADADRLLREATGWDIPARALSAWVLGARAPAAFGPAEITFAADGRPATLAQDGWQVAWSGWQAAPAGAAGVEVLPGRVEVRRDQARVRLVVDGWRSVPAAPGDGGG